jgi:hypothetical protein
MRQLVSVLLLGLLLAAPAGARAETPTDRPPDYARVEVRGTLTPFLDDFVVEVRLPNAKKPLKVSLFVGDNRQLKEQLEELAKKKAPVIVTGRLGPLPDQGPRGYGHNGLYPVFDLSTDAVLLDVKVRPAGDR